jgi:Na+/H+-dicarboxylate symporter
MNQTTERIIKTSVRGIAPLLPIFVFFGGFGIGKQGFALSWELSLLCGAFALFVFTVLIIWGYLVNQRNKRK